jgi:hypothetical protein
VVGAYGNSTYPNVCLLPGLYQKLAVAGYGDFEEYVLDMLLLGRDNAFARAVAQGDLVGDDAPLRRAAQHDLDVLQAGAMPYAIHRFASSYCFHG